MYKRQWVNTASGSLNLRYSPDSSAQIIGTIPVSYTHLDVYKRQIYGNLLTCYAQEGDRVYAGDVIATTIEGKPLVFELRRDGRSINPEGLLKPIPE